MSDRADRIKALTDRAKGPANGGGGVSRSDQIGALFGKGSGGEGQGLEGAQDRLDRALGKADEGGFFDWAKDVAGNGLSRGSQVLGGLMDVLDTPKSAVVATAIELGDVGRALTGQDPVGDTGSIKDSGVSLGDIIDNTRNNVGFGDVLEETELPMNAKRGLGFVGDVVLDPLTYLTAGASTATKAARTGSGAGRGRAILGADELVPRIIGLSDETLAAAGGSRALADEAATALATRRSAGVLGKAKFDPIRKALGDEVQVGLTFDFGKLGSKTVSPRAAGLVSDAGAITKGAFTKPVSWVVNRNGARRVGMDDFIAKWESIPGLRKLRRENPVLAVQTKHEIYGHRAATQNFRAKWAREWEALHRELGETVDKDTLRRALEDPQSFKEMDEAIPDAAVALRRFMDTMLAEAEEYTGKSVKRLENYLPHQVTADMLRMVAGDTEYTNLLRKRGLVPEAFVEGLESPSKATIDAIHDAAKEVFGEDYVQIFADDPWQIAGRYIDSVAALFGREGIYGRLERAGLAQQNVLDTVREASKSTVRNARRFEKEARALDRDARRASQRARKGEEKAFGASVRAQGEEKALRELRAESDDLLARLQASTDELVRQGRDPLDAQEEAIEKLVAANPRSIKAIDQRIKDIDAQIEGLDPAREVRDRLDRDAAAIADGPVQRAAEGEAAASLDAAESALSAADAEIADLDDVADQLRLLKDRFAAVTQDSGLSLEKAGAQLDSSLTRFVDNQAASIRGLVGQGPGGKNHKRNLEALVRDARAYAKAGGDPQEMITQVARQLDTAIDKAVLEPEQLLAVANAESTLLNTLRTVAEKRSGQWVPPTAVDAEVQAARNAFATAPEGSDFVELHGEIVAAEAKQKFAQIDSTVQLLKEADTPEAAEQLARLGQVFQSSIDAAAKDGGLDAQRRVMRALFTEGQVQEAKGVLAEAQDLARGVHVSKLTTPEPSAVIAEGIIDGQLKQFENVLKTNREARQAAYEATMLADTTYVRASAKADIAEALAEATSKRSLGRTEQSVKNARKRLDRYIEKRAEAMAISDDVSSGWPSATVPSTKIREETQALTVLNAAAKEARSRSLRGGDPLHESIQAQLRRVTDLEIALAEAKDPTMKAMVKQEQAAELAQAKAQREWRKVSKWDEEARQASGAAVEKWDTARELRVQAKEMNNYIDSWGRELREFAGRNNLWGDPDMVEAIATLTRLAEPERAKGLLRLHDQVLSRWKSYALVSPGYHSRNFFSGVWMNGLAGMDGGVGAYARFGRAWKEYDKLGDVDAALRKLGKGASPEYRAAFRDLVENEGAVFGRTKVRDLEDAVGTAGQRGLLGGDQGSLRRKLDPTALDNVLIETNFKAAGGIEKTLRGPLFIDSRLKGLTVDESIQRVAKFHFDYSDLAYNEKKWMRRIIPFYTWTRKNVPLQLEMMGKRPGYYSAYGHAQENLELGTPGEAIVPQYYGPFAIRSPFTSDQLPMNDAEKDRVYWMPDLPFTSLDDFFDFGKMRGQLSPLIKTPWELDRGAQFFSGAPFTGKYAEMPQTWAWMGPVLDVMDGRLGLPDVEKQGGSYYLSDRDAYKIEQALPLLGRLRRLAPSEEKYQDRMLTSWLSIMGGIGSQTNTEQAQASELLRRTREIEARLKRTSQLDKATVDSEG